LAGNSRQIHARLAPAVNTEGSSIAAFLLDLVFIAIGAAAFAVTALYLKGCASL
jgi:hypothetical protein